MTPQADIARWDELTAAERDALVAVHVMGWHADQDYYGHPVWNYAGKTGHADRWNPTTDRNDCAETVRAFEYAEIGTVFFEGKLKRIMFGRGQNISCLGATDWMTADPDSVCRAMLEARAEREDGA